jgi:tRNA G10  N-methylase Trm11
LLINNDPIMWTMLNAIKEQQTQIEAEQQLLDEQRGLITRQQDQINQHQKMIARQSSQLKQQQSENELQQIQIDGLKKLVCRKRWKVGICKQ